MPKTTTESQGLWLMYWNKIPLPSGQSKVNDFNLVSCLADTQYVLWLEKKKYAYPSVQPRSSRYATATSFSFLSQVSTLGSGVPLGLTQINTVDTVGRLTVTCGRHRIVTAQECRHKSHFLSFRESRNGMFLCVWKFRLLNSPVSLWKPNLKPLWYTFGSGWHMKIVREA